jgi:hypothetical protein
LKSQVAVSFEDNLVKVVYASEDKGKFVVRKTLSLRDEEFDLFLKANKMTNISVVYPFRKFYSDVIPAPPVKKNYLETIVHTEIRKRFPELNQFSSFYTVLTDKSTEEKGPRDVFFFAVDNREIDPIIERFDRCGKTVKFIYPDVLTLSYFAQSHDATVHKTVLCLLASNKDKSLFLVKNGQVRFIRITPSGSSDIKDTDIDNINMTVSYCQQQLRLNPERLVLLNSSITEDQGGTVIPVVRVTPHDSVTVPEETFQNYITPLSAIIFGNVLKNDNLLPKKYQVLYMQRFAVAYSILFFLLFSVIGFSYFMINLSDISSLHEKIESLRKQLVGTETVVAGYDKNAAELQQILPLINLINEVRSGPDIAKSLLNLNFLPMETVDIQSIVLNNKKDSLQIQVSGNIHANNLGNMHLTFQKLLNSFNKDSNMVVLSRNLDLKSGQFQIEMENKILP